MILSWYLLTLIGFLRVGKPSVIITEYRTVVENTSTSIHHHTIDTSKGLFNLIQHYNEISNNYHGSKIISLSNSPTNQILDIFVKSNDTTTVKLCYLDLNNPKMTYSVGEEHQVTYHESFFFIIKHNFVKPVYIAVVTYIACPKSITQYEENGWTQEETSKVICFPAFDRMNLELIIKDITYDFRFTHLWLLLSPLDSDMFMTRLRGVEMRNIYIITTMLPSFQFNSLQKKYPHLKISNIQKKDYSSSFFLNITEDITNIIENMTISKSYQYHSNVLHLLQQLLPPESFPATLKSSYNEEEKYIRVATVVYPPYMDYVPGEFPDKTNQCHIGQACNVPTTVNDTVVWKYLCCNGLAIEFFHLIAKNLDLKYHLYVAPDGRFGSLKNNRMNGMIGELFDGKADIAIQGIVPTTQRMNYARFTPGYMYSHSVIVLRTAKEILSILNWKFLQPLETSLLIAISVSTIATISFLYLSENSKYLFFENVSRYYFPSRETMTYIFGLTFQRDIGGRNPVNWSGRIAALSYAIAMTVVMTTYTAQLTANSITNNGYDDFNGLKDAKIMNPSSSFTFTVLKDTSEEQYFSNNPSDPKYAKIWHFVKQYYVTDNDEGVLKVYNGELDAFITDETSMLTKTSTQKYCSSLTIYNEVQRQSEVTFAYREDFAYEEIISNLILKYQESRIINDQKRKWIYAPSCNQYSIEDSRFTWMYFGGMLLIIGLAVLVCIIILLIENIYVFLQKGEQMQTDLA